jgi:deoxyribonuclease-4
MTASTTVAGSAHSERPDGRTGGNPMEPGETLRFTRPDGAAADGRPAVLVHAAYVLNTASPEEEKALRARSGLSREFECTTALGAYGVCFHPGSAGDSAPEDAAVRVGVTIRHALEAIPEGNGGTRLLIENTAGAGRTMGRTPEEIALMLAQVPAALRHRR